MLDLLSRLATSVPCARKCCSCTPARASLPRLTAFPRTSSALPICSCEPVCCWAGSSWHPVRRMRCSRLHCRPSRRRAGSLVRQTVRWRQALGSLVQQAALLRCRGRCLVRPAAQPQQVVGRSALQHPSSPKASLLDCLSSRSALMLRQQLPHRPAVSFVRQPAQHRRWRLRAQVCSVQPAALLPCWADFLVRQAAAPLLREVDLCLVRQAAAPPLRKVDCCLVLQAALQQNSPHQRRHGTSQTPMCCSVATSACRPSQVSCLLTESV